MIPKPTIRVSIPIALIFHNELRVADHISPSKEFRFTCLVNSGDE